MREFTCRKNAARQMAYSDQAPALTQLDEPLSVDTLLGMGKIIKSGRPGESVSVPFGLIGTGLRMELQDKDT